MAEHREPQGGEPEGAERPDPAAPSRGGTVPGGAGDRGAEVYEPAEAGASEPEAADAEPAPSEPEPEIGSSEWLLQQLTGGRRVRRRADTGEAEAAPAVAPPAEPEPAVTEPAVPEPAADPSADPSEEPTPPAASVPRIDQDGGFEALLRAGEERQPVVEEPEEVAGFHWNLTPGMTPEVEAAEQGSAPWDAGVSEPAPVAPEPAAPAESPVPVPPTTVFPTPATQPDLPTSSAAPASPATPAAGEPVTPGAFEPPSFAASLRMPSPGDAAEGSRPEQPRDQSAADASTASDAMGASPDETPVSPDETEQGHGLAALLGLGAADDEKPPTWSVIGDTTGIIPLPRDAVRPRSGAQRPEAPADRPAADMPAGVFVPPFAPEPVVPPIASVPPAAAAPPSFAAPQQPPAPAEPVLPPPPASRLFEPAAGADAPTAQLDAAEIAALLAVGRTSADRPEASLPDSGSSESEVVGVDPPAPAFDAVTTPPMPQAFPEESPADDRATADETETEIQTEAGPAPEPFAAADLGDGSPEASAADLTTAAGPAPDAFAAEDDDEDGLALLFGDVAADSEPDEGDASAVEPPAAEPSVAEPPAGEPLDRERGPSTAAAPAAPAAPAGINALLFPQESPAEASAVDQPGAADEGPQASGTAAVDGVPAATAPTAAFDFDAPTIALPAQPESEEAAAHLPGDEPPHAPAHAAASTTHGVPPAKTWPARPNASDGIAPITGSSGAVAGSPFTGSAGASAAPTSEAPAGSSAAATTTTAPPTTAPRRPFDLKEHRLLFAIAGGLAVLLVLVGLFALGTRLPSLFGAAAPVAPPASASASATPSSAPKPTPTPTPTVTPKPAAPAAAGEQKWDALGGGECIQPFTTPWAETFTVVDCATPHAAQLVWTDVLSADLAAPYPGTDALAQQIGALCTAPGVIDLAAGAEYTGLQVQGSFPATEQQWAAGQRSYYCFVSRSTGEPLTTSVAGGGPTG